MFSLLIDGSTLRQAGHMAKLSLQTVLLWRRKIEESAKNKGPSDVFRECPCGQDLRQCGQTPRAFSQEGSLQEQAENRSCGR